MKKILTTGALMLGLTIAVTAFAAEEYGVSIERPTAKAKERAVAKISVRPKGPHHVNVDYPTKLTLKASDGVTVEKTLQTGKEAARFEKDGLDFEVAFVAGEKGTKSFTGTIFFAMCTETNCKPAKEPVAFDVDVN